jgi:hypothetical protein
MRVVKQIIGWPIVLISGFFVFILIPILGFGEKLIK